MRSTLNAAVRILGILYGTIVLVLYGTMIPISFSYIGLPGEELQPLICLLSIGNAALSVYILKMAFSPEWE